MALFNLVDKFVPLIDERFTAESYATGVCGANYSFDGANTIKIHSLPTVPMYDYDRHGTDTTRASRYGKAVDIQASIQKMTITRDRSFSFIVDRADNIQSAAVIDANKTLSRQTDEVIIPEYDRYVFNKLAATATASGHYSKLRDWGTNASKSSAAGKRDALAYDLFLGAAEFLGDHMVPDEGRVALCSYAMVTALKQDPGFVLASELSQDMIYKGVVGMVDGILIKRVPSNRLPVGCGAIITHPYVSVAPEQLKDYKIHDNPPGINGWLCEGRIIYDCFVLDNKLDGIYYIGLDGVSRNMNVITVPNYKTAFSTTQSNTATLVIQDYEVTDPISGSAFSYYYKIVDAGTAPVQPDYSGFSATGWTAITGSMVDGLTGTDGQFVQVVQVLDGNVTGYGVTKLHLYDALS